MSGEKRGKVITFACRKGGVGKTSGVFNLAGTLDALGYKVLAMDFDGQCSLTRAESKNDSVEVVEGQDVWALLKPEGADPVELITKGENFDFVAGSRKADTAEKNVDSALATFALNTALIEYREMYDFIIIDTPPAAGTLIGLGISISDMVIVPIHMDDFGVDGIETPYEVVKELSRIKMRPTENMWILPNVVESRTRLDKQIRESLEENPEYKDLLLDFNIRKSTKVKETTSVGQPLVYYAPKAAAMEDYTKLADFVIENASKEGK